MMMMMMTMMMMIAKAVMMIMVTPVDMPAIRSETVPYIVWHTEYRPIPRS